MRSRTLQRRRACPLLDALPLELRQQIYAEVLFSNGNFFSLDEEVGISVPNLFPKIRPQSPGGLPASRLQRRRRDPSDILSLLLTCRKIYGEAVRILYSRAFFRLRGITATTSFFAHAPPHCLDLIRSIKLVWDDSGWIGSPLSRADVRNAWLSLCELLAHLRSLTNLYIGLGVDGDAGVEARYLDALRQIEGVPNFKICVPVGILRAHYGLSTDKEYLNAPFKLCRHVAGEVCQWRREILEAEREARGTSER